MGKKTRSPGKSEKPSPGYQSTNDATYAAQRAGGNSKVKDPSGPGKGKTHGRPSTKLSPGYQNTK